MLEHMFQLISYEVQNRIFPWVVLSLEHNFNNSWHYCQFVLLLMGKFPQKFCSFLTTQYHLLEAFVQNTSSSNHKNYIIILIFYVISLIIQNSPADLSLNLMHRILTLKLKFCASKIFLFNNGSAVPAEFSGTADLTKSMWSQIVQLVSDVCGRILKLNQEWFSCLTIKIGRFLSAKTLSLRFTARPRLAFFYGTDSVLWD